VHFTTQQEAIVSHRFGATTKDMVLPLGVELPPLPEHLEALQAALRSEWGLPSDRPLLLFLSRLDPKKGLDLLLAASQRLQTEGKPFHLVLAGGNPQDPAYEAQIRQQVAQSPLKDCTTITGFVRGDRKRALLSLADCFVLPSAYENFGIAVAEGMAAGVPVVISKGVYIWQEIQAAQAGWVCETSVESLYGSLIQALDSGSERRRRGQNAQDYAAQHYQWDAIAQSLLGMYRGLV
jgi:glycosyltransferase involved in cell wall biosynthesis